MSDCLYGKLNSETIIEKYEGVESGTAKISIDSKNRIEAEVLKTPKTLTITKNSESGNEIEYKFDGSEDINIDLHEVDVYSGKSTNETASVIVNKEENSIDVQVLKTPGTLTITKGEEELGQFNGNENLSIDIPDVDLSDIETDIDNAKQDISSIQESLSSAEEILSILKTDGDGTKYLADDGQYKEIVDEANGIEQLVGTLESPVNLYNLKSGQLYAVQNYVGSTSDYYTITSGALLVYKQSSNICIFEHCRLVSSSRIINITNSTLSQSYLVTVKSSGQLTIEVASTGVNRLNGSTDYLGPVSFFAPINGGANGQILQANGYSSAPTWITPSYASQSYVDTQIANLVDSAPEQLNTLKELATAIQEHKDILDAIGELPTVTRLI